MTLGAFASASARLACVRSQRAGLGPESWRAVEYKSMNHAQNYLAQANRQIPELTVQIARQRVVVKHALDTGQRLEMAESLLDALEESVRIFEKHRIFVLSCSGSSAPFRGVTPRRAGACHDATGMERHDKHGLLGRWPRRQKIA